MATIFVADDEEPVLRLVQALLEGSGHAVIADTNPTRILARLLASEVPPELLITDYKMLEMTGVALARQVMSAEPGVRVMVITGYASDPGLEALPPSVTVLAKPFTPDQFRTAVSELLAASEAA